MRTYCVCHEDRVSSKPMQHARLTDVTWPPGHADGPPVMMNDHVGGEVKSPPPRQTCWCSRRRDRGPTPPAIITPSHAPDAPAARSAGRHQRVVLHPTALRWTHRGVISLVQRVHITEPLPMTIIERRVRLVAAGRGAGADWSAAEEAANQRRAARSAGRPARRPDSARLRNAIGDRIDASVVDYSLAACF